MPLAPELPEVEPPCDVSLDEPLLDLSLDVPPVILSLDEPLLDLSLDEPLLDLPLEESLLDLSLDVPLLLSLDEPPVALSEDGWLFVSRAALSMQSLRSWSPLRFLHACIASALEPDLSLLPVLAAWSVAVGVGSRSLGVVRSVGWVGKVEGEPDVALLLSEGEVLVWAAAPPAARASVAAVARR